MRVGVLKNTTDWDNYYKKAPGLTGFSRKISERKIIGLLTKYSKVLNPNIIEFGGANSCFVEAIIDVIDPTKYTVVDTNTLGLEMFESKFQNLDKTSTIIADVTTLPQAGKVIEANSDIVFSVGLIEHFEVDGTSDCIKSHFYAAKPNGLVLITFPTPTFLYRIIRKCAEMLNVWDFPDERPLGFPEVKASCEPYGELLHDSINWKIGLTQGYVLYRRNENFYTSRHEC